MGVHGVSSGDLGSGPDGGGQAIPEPVQKKTWASVVTSNQKASVKLRYFPPPNLSDPVVVMPPRENSAKWDTCLVGYFLERKLNFNYVKTYAFNFWRDKGLREVISTNNGFMFFLFDSVENSANVLEGGPCFFVSCFLNFF